MGDVIEYQRSEIVLCKYDKVFCGDNSVISLKYCFSTPTIESIWSKKVSSIRFKFCA